LKLPEEVVEIISEHHGNSLIAWFYNKAVEEREAAGETATALDLNDYSYSGMPPRSRESVIVMLADTVEAAVRSLNKPTKEQIEGFVDELISKKVEHGQLSQAELTHRELEIVKNTFIRVLQGHHHSRIVYPKIALPKAERT
jgi:membrane-associated HD superfamily phosphohydrolase